MKPHHHDKPALIQRRQFSSLCCALITLTTLGACSSAPPAPPAADVVDPQAKKKIALRDLGFEPTENGWELNLSGRITFSVNDATLSAEGIETVSRVAKTLLGIGILRISVDGHTDNQGSAALNQDLSERRAEATAQAFVAQGCKAGDITRRGFGFSRPVGDNNSEAGRQLNRRVTIIVSSL